MPTASAGSVRKQIASGSVDSVYLLQGEDEIEKLSLAHEFDELVEDGLRAFNVERIHVAEATTGEKVAAAVAAIASAVRTLPMMAPRRIVVVVRAEAILMPKRESEVAARALDELETLLKHPEPQTTLVLVAASLDKRGRLYKALLKHATVVECGVLEGGADVERWVRTRVEASGVKIEPPAARLLAERCGTDVRRLRNDVERLMLYALGQKTITVDDARQIVGPASLQDDWAMTNAIEAGQGAVALRQLALMLDAGAAPEKVLGQLAWLVRTRLSAASSSRLVSAVDALFRTDLDLKRSAADARVLLERLVVELCGGRRSYGRS
jgi:DNA polymerase III subunit delta